MRGQPLACTRGSVPRAASLNTVHLITFLCYSVLGREAPRYTGNDGIPRRCAVEQSRSAVPDGLNDSTLAEQRKESIHYVAIKAGDIDVFLFEPSTEIRDHHNMTSNGTHRVSLLGYKARICIQVSAERLIPEPLNGAGEGKELVYHSRSMPSGVQDYAT